MKLSNYIEDLQKKRFYKNIIIEDVWIEFIVRDLSSRLLSQGIHKKLVVKARGKYIICWSIKVM